MCQAGIDLGPMMDWTLDNRLKGLKCLKKDV